MSSLLLNREVVNVDIEPASFDAFSLNPFGMKVSKFTLELDRDGLKLVNKKGKVISTAAWYELEELKNEIREKGRFSYFGTLQTSLNDVRVVIKVNVDDGERERLAKIFDKLPQDVFGRKCPDCGGSVVDNICKNCGQSFTGQQRRKGLKLILGGSVLLVAGILLSYLTYSPSSGSMWLFYGPILFGAGLIIVGLIGLVFGKRVSA